MWRSLLYFKIAQTCIARITLDYFLAELSEWTLACIGVLPPIIGIQVAFQGVNVNVMRNSRRAMIKQHTLNAVNLALELIN